jgi:hypothetical protein
VNEGEEASNVNDEESAQEEAKRAAIAAAHLSSPLSLSPSPFLCVSVSSPLPKQTLIENQSGTCTMPK